jgi:hypothetical protein
MSKGSYNLEKKRNGNFRDKIMRSYKEKIDNGSSIDDLNLNVFEESILEYENILKQYISHHKGLKIKGIDLW